MVARPPVDRVVGDCVTRDSRLRLYGTRIREAVQGTERVRRCSARVRSACPDVMAWATILVEMFGGLSVLLGAFVRVASIPMAAVLLVAMFTVHLPYGFSSIKLVAVTSAGAQFGPPGYEVDLLYIACLAALVLGGSGPFSVDGLIARRRASTAEPTPRRLSGGGS